MTKPRIKLRLKPCFSASLKTDSDPVSLAIDAAGSGPKLAERLSAQGAPLTARAIYQWRSRWLAGNHRAIPDVRAIELEIAVGIPRHVFRPDLWPQDRAA